MARTATAVSKFSANCRVTADMDVRRTAGAAAGVLMWTGIAHAQVTAVKGEMPTIVVYVEDRAGLRSDVTASAEQELVRIYGLAGVHAVWKDAFPGTAEPEKDGVASVVVVMLDAAATKRYVAAERLNADVLGVAIRGANRAYLFFAQIEYVARVHARHLGTLLGAAVAHKVGHMLLPPGTHSFGGIMRADLGVRSLMMPPRFTATQAAEIVRTLKTRQQHSKSAMAR